MSAETQPDRLGFAERFAAFMWRDVIFPGVAIYGYFNPPGGTLEYWMLPFLSALASVPLAARGFKRREPAPEDESA